MSSRLMTDDQNPLHSINRMRMPQPAVLRVASTIISYIFHPVFIPVYIIWFMVYQHPYQFAGFTDWDKTKVLLQAFVMFTFFPVVTVLLLKALKFISSFHLDTQKDRIIPLIACGIWYFWVWYVWRNLPDYPQPAIQFALGIWIASSLGLMANIIMKISLHAMSLGVMLAFIVLLALSQQLNFGIYISAALFITGLVCTARLIVSDHTEKEIYYGLAVGILSMMIAFWAG